MADLERVTRLELVPVVEVPAWAFSERPMPEGPSRDHRDAWARYWLECLADAGVIGLLPIERGSMHVATSEFTDPVQIGQVLRRLVGPETLTDPEAASALYGGIAVESGDHVLTEPHCCGDLADWTEWRSVVTHREAAWKIVWTGHPWLSARGEGDDLILSSPHESDAPEPRWVLDRGLIPPAVDAAVAELESFASRIAAALLDADGNGSHAVRIARILAGLPTEDEGRRA